MFLNEAQISVTGYVATQPTVRSVTSGAVYTSMRVAWTPRRQDRETGEWVDGNTSYATVICWRKLATHAALSLRKGDPVMVRGRLSIRNYDDKNGVRRISVEVEATSVGHDLSRGVAIFQRTRPSPGLTAAQHAALNGESTGAGLASAAAGGASAEIEATARKLDEQLDDAVRAGAAELRPPGSAADLDDPFLDDPRLSGAVAGADSSAGPAADLEAEPRIESEAGSGTEREAEPVAVPF